MVERGSVPARVAERPSFLKGLLAFIAPHRFSEPLVRADHAAELDRDPSLRQAAAATQLERLNATRQNTIDRLLRLRRAVLISCMSLGSAVLVAALFRTTNIAPMLPRPTLAVGSILCFAVATLWRLVWRRQSSTGDISAELFAQRSLHVLYWMGMCWGVLAIW